MSHTGASLLPKPSTTMYSLTSDRNENRVTRKRNRVPVSCHACRQRKLKCNRGLPCDNCTKRGDRDCRYAVTPTRKRGSATTLSNPTPDDMQNRIDRLENLVLSLISEEGTGPQSSVESPSTGNSYGGASLDLTSSRTTESVDPERNEGAKRDDDAEDEDVRDVSQGLGVMRVHHGKTFYYSDHHWYTLLLEDIQELRCAMTSSGKAFEAQQSKIASVAPHDAAGASYLFRSERINDKSELISQLPSKAVMDQLVTHYFNCYDPAVHIIHGPTFSTKYETHWARPEESSVVFVSLLFAIMTIAIQSYQRAPADTYQHLGDLAAMASRYRQLTAQGLVLADYRDQFPYLLETLLLHLQAEYTRAHDTESGIMFLISLIVRHAMRLGYHREPSNYNTTINPYEGEMRRRMWASVRLFDYSYSFQCGMPAIIRSNCVDAQLPRNLYDDELREDMTVLPPSRGDADATPMSYMLAKTKLGLLFGKVYDRVHQLEDPPSYEEVIELDTALRQGRSQLPPHLRYRSLPDSSQDAPSLVLQRLGLEITYLKAICILHRRFVARGRASSRYAHSRQTCVDAAMDLLTHHATLYKETLPSGRFESVKWTLTSLSAVEFTTAATLLCVDLNNAFEDERLGRRGSTIEPRLGDEAYVQSHRSQILSTLRGTQAIWEKLGDYSFEAYKSHRVISVMIGVLTDKQIRSERRANGGIDSTVAESPRGGDNVAPEHSAAMTLGLLSSGVPTVRQVPAQSNVQVATPMADPRNANDNRSNGYEHYAAAKTGVNDASAGVDMADMSNSVANMMGGFGPTDDIEWGAFDAYMQSTMPNQYGIWPSMAMPMEQMAIDPEIQSQLQVLPAAMGPAVDGLPPSNLYPSTSYTH